MTNTPEQQDSRLSEAGKARRDRMLPLIQDAMREGVRRRRRRRSVAGMVVLLCAAILGWELVESNRSNRIEAPQDRLVEETSGLKNPSRTEGLLATDDVEKTKDSKWGDADWSSFDPEEAYASLMGSGEPIMVTSKMVVPSEWLIQGTSTELDFQTVGTRDLVAMLARSGINASVICTADNCVLVTSKTEDTPTSSL